MDHLAFPQPKKPKEITMNKVLFDREPLLTTAAVSKWLGIAPRTVCLWAECQEIPAIKVGRQWRFRECELCEWLRSPGAKLKDYSNSRVTAAMI